VLVLIGTLIRWSLSVRKRAKAMVNLIKLTTLLDEAKCYEVIRQLRWPDGVVWHRQLDRRLSAVGQLAGVGAALVRD
jgi:hypothetical protein